MGNEALKSKRVFIFLCPLMQMFGVVSPFPNRRQKSSGGLLATGSGLRAGLPSHFVCISSKCDKSMGRKLHIDNAQAPPVSFP